MVVSATVLVQEQLVVLTLVILLKVAVSATNYLLLLQDQGGSALLGNLVATILVCRHLAEVPRLVLLFSLAFLLFFIVPVAEH